MKKISDIIIKIFWLGVFTIVVIYLCGWPLYKVVDYLIPVDIKDAIENKNLTLYNKNITDEFFKKYLPANLKEFRCPIIKDLIERGRYRLFRQPKPVILVHQAFYSYIYFENGPNYLTIPIITIKNIGRKTAIITRLNIDIDSATKHDYEDPSFNDFLPIVLFPNEEILFCYGQEIPPAKFRSTVMVAYEDLEGNKYKLPRPHEKNFLYDFNKKIYQFYF